MKAKPILDKETNADVYALGDLSPEMAAIVEALLEHTDDGTGKPVCGAVEFEPDLLVDSSLASDCAACRNVRMIGDDCRLAEALHRAAASHPELEAFTCALSIATFRYVPRDLRGKADAEEHLNALNQELLRRIRLGGEAFLTSTELSGRFVLRACIVNYRSTRRDIDRMLAAIRAIGRELVA